jgi:hypothetical protein
MSTTLQDAEGLAGRLRLLVGRKGSLARSDWDACADAATELDRLTTALASAEEEGSAEVVEARTDILACFTELDRLEIVLALKGDEGDEQYVPMLAHRLRGRLAAARTPKHEDPSEVVARRFRELRTRLADAEKERNGARFAEDVAEKRVAELEAELLDERGGYGRVIPADVHPQAAGACIHGQDVFGPCRECRLLASAPAAEPEAAQ